MSVTLLVQGGEVELAENFNLVRHRLNAAFKSVEDYRNGDWDADAHKQSNNKDGVPRPFHDLSFITADEDGDPEGRVTISYEKIIGVTSDELRDVEPSAPAGVDDEEEEYDEDDDEDEEED